MESHICITHPNIDQPDDLLSYKSGYFVSKESRAVMEWCDVLAALMDGVKARLTQAS